tara:strand:- start:6485 stop:6967 length:483 start_codon:yes stop_codon:yes gene_type:complete
MRHGNKKLLSMTFMKMISISLLFIGSVALALPKAVVYRTPTCGCCIKWVDHLKENGFEVEVINKRNLNPIKQVLGVPSHLKSCHTAKIGRYTIEGHVPAKDILRLLKKGLDIKGLAVEGMPLGSPGMEYKNKLDPYDVVSFKKDGTTGVFNSYHKEKSKK